MRATANHRIGQQGVEAGMPRSGRAGFGLGSASALSMKWSALHDAAEAVAAICGMPCPPLSQLVRAYPAMMRDAGEAHRALAAQGIEDLTAIMEPGLAALAAAMARGAHPRAAALALWDEFCRARDALLALAPPQDTAMRRMA